MHTCNPVPPLKPGVHVGARPARVRRTVVHDRPAGRGREPRGRRRRWAVACQCVRTASAMPRPRASSLLGALVLCAGASEPAGAAAPTWADQELAPAKLPKAARGAPRVRHFALSVRWSRPYPLVRLPVGSWYPTPVPRFFRRRLRASTDYYSYSTTATPYGSHRHVLRRAPSGPQACVLAPSARVTLAPWRGRKMGSTFTGRATAAPRPSQRRPRQRCATTGECCATARRWPPS